MTGGRISPPVLRIACTPQTRLRIRSWSAASPTAGGRAKILRSPLTEYWRAGNVTFRQPSPRLSQTPKPISFGPRAKKMRRDTRSGALTVQKTVRKESSRQSTDLVLDVIELKREFSLDVAQ